MDGCATTTTNGWTKITDGWPELYDDNGSGMSYINDVDRE